MRNGAPLAVALLAAAVAAAVAAEPGDRCVPGHTPGHWGDRVVVDEEEVYAWVRDGDAAGCTYEVESRDDLLRALRGRHVVFVGDSTTRLMFYELLLWGWGCLPGDIEGALATVGPRFVGYGYETSTVGPQTADSLGSLCHTVAQSQR
jgi:hypothetical protein